MSSILCELYFLHFANLQKHREAVESETNLQTVMAMTRTVSVLLLFAMLALHHSLADDAPMDSPSPAPAPVTGADDFSPPAPAPTPDSHSKTVPSDASSPPAPPPVDLGSPSPSPSPADANASSPASDSQVAKDVTQVSTNEEKTSGRGKKVGIAVGVVAGACVVGLGALVYKKRRDNIRRSQYGQDARGSLL